MSGRHVVGDTRAPLHQFRQKIQEVAAGVDVVADLLAPHALFFVLFPQLVNLGALGTRIVRMPCLATALLAWQQFERCDTA